MISHRSEIVLGAMASGPRRAYFDPVRIQKLLFLIDAQISDLVGGPHFDFRPHTYGPFDIEVYFELEELTESAHVHTDLTWRYNRYRLTDAGHTAGSVVLDNVAGSARGFMARACRWTLAVSHGDLLSAIYRRYPKMAASSMVPGLAPAHYRPKRQTIGAALLTGMARTLDIMGVLDQPEVHLSGYFADARSIATDWQAVGDDMRIALGQHAEAGSQ